MNALPLQFLMLIFAGWVNRHQQDVIEYLQEENRALREQLGGKRLRFTDRQRRRHRISSQTTRTPSSASTVDSALCTAKSPATHDLEIRQSPIDSSLASDAEVVVDTRRSRSTRLREISTTVAS